MTSAHHSEPTKQREGQLGEDTLVPHRMSG